ncbi:MAG: Gfo/Idh/MocA family oxidoreductase [Verrucomicrobia bacterium]|nr:Gfo/Idh/MocA family oxidoreductase [Verrucomicrobiota bacterium]
MDSPLQIAVVGSGIGSEHVQGFHAFPDLFSVKMLCDISRERAASVAEKFRIPEVTANFSDLCSRPDIDVIDICTPPNLHSAQIQEALKAGKHVICEKPLVESLAVLDSISRLAEESGRQVMPIFQYRFGHGLQKLKYLADLKLTGEAFVFNVDVAWLRSREYYRNSWRGRKATELGGALLSQAIHAVDMILYILGPVRSVFGRAATRVNEIEVEDCLAIVLEMADGSLGTLSVTLGSVAEISRHRFTFRNISAESSTEPYSNSREPWIFCFDADSVESGITNALNQFHPLPEGYAGQFYRFYHAVQNGVELPVTMGDARATLEVVAAVYHSSETGKPVQLPIGPGHAKYEGF